MSYAKSMQCPKCKSQYTQSVETAYSQAVRTGETGYQSISEFGRSMEPPEPRSEVGVPFATAFFVAGTLMMLLPGLHSVLPFEWLEGLSPFDTPVVIVSLVVGLIVGFWSAVSAGVYNASVYRGEMKTWAKGVVCRRCGHRFRR